MTGILCLNFWLLGKYMSTIGFSIKAVAQAWDLEQPEACYSFVVKHFQYFVHLPYHPSQNIEFHRRLIRAEAFFTVYASEATFFADLPPTSQLRVPLLPPSCQATGAKRSFYNELDAVRLPSPDPCLPPH